MGTGLRGAVASFQPLVPLSQEGTAMNRLKDLLVVLALVMTLAFPLLARAQDADGATATATALLDAMDAGDYAGAEAMFTPDMAQAVPAERLQAVWESLPAQAGPARGRGEPQVSEGPA